MQVNLQMSQNDETRARIEAALYAAGRPLELNDLLRAAGITSRREALKSVRKISKSLNDNMLALEIVELSNEKFVMQLKTQYTNVARRFAIRPLMSQAVLRTLSHIAYFQPISGSELAERRGPQAYNHLKKLLEMNFIENEKSGRNKIYRTSNIFSEYFGVSNDPVKIRQWVEQNPERIKHHSASGNW